MTLRLRNTLTRQVEPVEPLDGRPGPDVHLRPDRLPLRPRRQPAQRTCSPTSIRRTLLYHGIEVLHVKNITDVGHLRDERFDRGEDRMLVAAGLEHKTPAEIADAYEAAFHADEALVNILPAHVFPRATEHIPEMLDARRAARGRRPRLRHAPRATSTTTSRRSRLRRGCRATRSTTLRAGHRGDIEPDKRDPADFALWKAAGEGRLLKWPTAALGRGLPGLAPRVLGDGDALPRAAVRHPHRRHRQRLPAPRGRDRPVGADRRRRPGPPLGPRRVPADGGQEDGQVGRQLPARHRAGRSRASTRWRSATSCLTSRYAHKLEYSDESLSTAAAGRPDLASRRRCGRSVRAPVDGPWRAAGPPLRAAAAGDRPTGTAHGVAGHGDGMRAADRAVGPRPTRRTCRCPTAGRAFHERFVAAIDDDLDMPTALAVVREMLRADLPADERRWLVLDADLVLGLDLDRVWDELAAGDAVPDDVQALVDQRAAARAARDFARADALRAEMAGLGYEVTDGPDGPPVRRR